MQAVTLDVCPADAGIGLRFGYLVVTLDDGGVDLARGC
jgi:hypothetical protein